MRILTSDTKPEDLSAEGFTVTTIMPGDGMAAGKFRVAFGRSPVEGAINEFWFYEADGTPCFGSAWGSLPRLTVAEPVVEEAPPSFVKTVFEATIGDIRSVAKEVWAANQALPEGMRWRTYLVFNKQVLHLSSYHDVDDMIRDYFLMMNEGAKA